MGPAYKKNQFKNQPLKHFVTHLVQLDFFIHNNQVQ